MKKQLIEDKTFKTHCLFISNCTEQEFLDYINKRCKTNYKAGGASGKAVYYEDDKHLFCFIWVNDNKNYTTLAHEILHLIRFWLQDYYGINLNEQTEEIYTMLHSFYFKKIYKKL